jgi:hypothetical protein
MATATTARDPRHHTQKMQMIVLDEIAHDLGRASEDGGIEVASQW